MTAGEVPIGSQVRAVRATSGAEAVAGTVYRECWDGLGHTHIRLNGYDFAIPASWDVTVIEHPEQVCHRCLGPNVSWVAPSPLWNEVMRGGDINGPWQYGEIICPTCFAVLAEAAGVATGSWMLRPDKVHVLLQTVTPSARVWNEATQLWDEPDGGVA